MALRINDVAPNFTAETSDGKINFHEWIGDSWAVLFSHPKDFTPVCTTESWAKDIEETQGHAPNYPIIGDAELNVAKLYDMLQASETPGQRTPADNQTVRTVFMIGPDKKIKAMLIYPMSSGRNFDEILRLLDSIQLSAKQSVATPVNWKPGDDVIIPTAVSDDDAKKKYPQGFKTHKPYLRTVSLKN